MKNAAFTLLCLAMTTCCLGADWLTLPSTFSHDPVTRQRVSQYQSVAAPTAPVASNFQTSGYTHLRSSLNYGQSADNYHRVESWGPPVRPYGEWRFPFRPYSVPYAEWGAPFAGLNLGPNFFGGPAFGQPGRPNHPGRPTHPGGPNQPSWPNQPGGQGNQHGGPNFGRPGLGGSGWGGSGLGPGHFNSPGFQPSPNSGYGSGPPFDAGSLNPYPFGPGTPYPSAPYYDGYYPNYRQ